MRLRFGENRTNLRRAPAACLRRAGHPAGCRGCGSRVHLIGGHRRLAFSLAAASRAFGVRFAGAGFCALHPAFAPLHRQRCAHPQARRRAGAAHTRQRRGVQSDGPGPFRCRFLLGGGHPDASPRRARGGVPEHGGAQQRGGDAARRFPIDELLFAARRRGSSKGPGQGTVSRSRSICHHLRLVPVSEYSSSKIIHENGLLSID